MFVVSDLSSWLTGVVTEVYRNSGLYDLRFAGVTRRFAEELVSEESSDVSAEDLYVSEVLRRIVNSGVSNEISEPQQKLHSKCYDWWNEGSVLDSSNVRLLSGDISASARNALSRSFSKREDKVPQGIDFAHAKDGWILKYSRTSGELEFNVTVWGTLRCSSLAQESCTIYRGGQEVADFSLLSLSLVPAFRLRCSNGKLDQRQLEEDFREVFQLCNLVCDCAD